MGEQKDTVDVASLASWIRRFAASVNEHRDELTALDSAIGDADHGVNLDRGMSAVVAALDAAGSPSAGSPSAGSPSAGALFKQVGMTLVSKVGGASGPLFGTLFLRMATAAGNEEQLDGAGLTGALRAGLDGVAARGKAVLGDKTMIDALAPAVDTLDAALAEQRSLADSLAAASAAADKGRDATIPMQARKGRASYLGERSIGHQDPGATSMALLIAAAAASFTD
jgi:phosphoenolpyruvate---glycerone phosphotransferase subunit DhaL